LPRGNITLCFLRTIKEVWSPSSTVKSKYDLYKDDFSICSVNSPAMSGLDRPQWSITQNWAPLTYVDNLRILTHYLAYWGVERQVFGLGHSSSGRAIALSSFKTQYQKNNKKKLSSISSLEI
jgi:hypothetical protein